MELLEMEGVKGEFLTFFFVEWIDATAATETMGLIMFDPYLKDFQSSFETRPEHCPVTNKNLLVRSTSICREELIGTKM